MASTPASAFDDPLLIEFLKALENAAEPEVVLARYGTRHPARVEELRTLAEMTRLLRQAETAPEPPVPPRLGEFRLVRRVGQGGMGEIYEAYQDRLQRRVAVKIIRQGRISPDAHARFLREQQALAQLHQTHIVPIHTAGEHGSLQHFAMPYIDGAALHHAIHLARQLEATPSGKRLPTLAELASLVARSPRPAPAADRTTKSKAQSEVALESARARDGQTPPGAGGIEASRPRLSAAYFRSVAQLLADAADAVHHAHGAGILHRDLKPSNIMVDVHGQCWIIDFGLSAWLANSSDPATAPRAPIEAEPVTRSGVLGTPQYMAPEQCRGKADERTDVWGLGVTLYELLTLHQAFPGHSSSAVHERIQTAEPPSPRQWVANVPADLSAICRKALHKEPGERYPTAAAFAEDLRRWLGLEPTEARPAQTLRRTWLWGRRNPGWAAAILLAIALLGGGMLYLKQALAAAETAKELAVQQSATTAEAARQQKRENLLQKLQIVLRSPHEVGWSDKAWQLGKEAAAIRPTDDLRGPMVAALAELDLHPVLPIDHVPTSTVVFDKDGRWLLLGGTNDPLGKPAAQARIYDRLTGASTLSGLAGDGPVAFRPDGFALQARLSDQGTVRLWDMKGQKPIRELRSPLAAQRGSVKPTTPRSCTFSNDGHLVAASLGPVGERGRLTLWETDTGKVLWSKPVAALCLRFSPDGKYLAAGEENGRVTAWSAHDGHQVCTVNAGRQQINSVTFARHPLRPLDDQRDQSREWFLVAGDWGGTVTIWDFPGGAVQAPWHGSAFGVYSLDASPDGTLLAVGGENGSYVLDAATGALLLTGHVHDGFTGVNFSPNGHELAVYTDAGERDSWISTFELEHGRGLHALRGLTAQVRKVWLSPDGLLVAGLSDRWELGVWELPSGRLRYVFEAPLGYSSDNAGCAFDSKGKRLAFSAGKQAVLWDLDSGKRLQRWPLPPGLQDLLAFHHSGKLLSLRVETDTMQEPPLSDSIRPRVCRVRDLCSAHPLESLYEKSDFNVRVNDSTVSLDGATYIVQGRSGTRGGPTTGATIVWDALSGKQLWSLPFDSNYKYGPAGAALDPQGQIVFVGTRYDAGRVLLGLRTEKLLTGLGDHVNPLALSPGAAYMAQAVAGEFILWRRDKERPLFVVRAGRGAASITCPFNAAGTQVAWGNTDGSLIVCDLLEVQKRLARAGLGW